MKILDFDLEGSHFIIEADISPRQEADDDTMQTATICESCFAQMTVVSFPIMNLPILAFSIQNNVFRMAPNAFYRLPSTSRIW